MLINSITWSRSGEGGGGGGGGIHISPPLCDTLHVTQKSDSWKTLQETNMADGLNWCGS